MFELRTFGGLELLHKGDRDTSAIPMQAKRLALLAYLAALPCNAFRRRDTLLLLFWPDLDQAHARGALRQALHFLKKTVGDGAILTRGEDEIRLDPARLDSDARALEGAVTAGDPAQALALYRGEFLDGVFVTDASPDLEDWISAERLRLRGLAAKAAWMASELPANREQAGILVRRAVQWSGDDEAALRRGVRLLDGMGDRAGAAALYDDFARRVARDLDVELSRETRDLIRALRARRDSGGIDRNTVAISSRPLDDVRSVSEAAAPRAPAARAGKRLLVASIAGALLMLALAAKMSPRKTGLAKASADIIAVMPFRLSDADSSLAWLQEDIIELLTIRLVGSGIPRLADPAAVIASWQRQAGSEPVVSHEAALKVASRVGAARLIEGSITGTRQHLTLSARLSSVAGTELLTRAVAEGPADSLPQLIDRLAAQLLGMAAGMEGAELASLTSTSLPAIRAFLAGQAAFRKGRMETAVLRYDEAIDLDSTFALAGLQLCRAAIWAGTEKHTERGCRIAKVGRDRLSPADKVLVDASATEWATAPEMFAALNAAVTAYPERPEIWYTLGDVHFHGGALIGEERWMDHAAEAFRRGWLLDSAAGAGTVGELPVAEPMLHLVQLAHMRYDTAEVVRLVGSVLAVDSTSALAWTLRWHRAMVTNDAAHAEFWRKIGSAPQRATMQIVLFIIWTGVGDQDLERVRKIDEAFLRAHDPGYATFAFTVTALNNGRPRDIPQQASSGASANKLHRARIRYAMSWDGDTTAALESARVLSRSAASVASGESARQQLYDICTLGEWQASRGEHEATALAIARLRRARSELPVPSDSVQTVRYLTLCITLLEAMHASGRGLASARQSVAVADSVARDLFDGICCDRERVSDANIQLARLWEREGDLPAARRALARRSGVFGIQPMYLSTFAREEGRIAAQMGDTAAAVSAWRHYLAFRPNPQPSLKPGVDSVRLELAALEAN